MNKTQTAPAIAWLTLSAMLITTLTGLTHSPTVSAEVSKSSVAPTEEARTILSKYTVNLTQLAAQGKLEVVQSVDPEVGRVIANLARASAKAPVVIAESDLDRRAIARGVAFRIAAGNVPESLRGKRVLSLSLDALATNAKTSQEFERRVQMLFTAAAEARDEIILFVDQLHEYAGARATAIASATVKNAIEKNHLRIIGGASLAAFATYIAADASIGRLFESIWIDRVDGVASTTGEARDKRCSPINKEFVGEKVSSNMRELMRTAGRNGRVPTILQVSDVNSKDVRTLLARYGVLISDSMAHLGTMKIDLPVQAIDALMKSDAMNYDGVVIGDAAVWAMSNYAMIYGDPGPSMRR